MSPIYSFIACPTTREKLFRIIQKNIFHSCELKRSDPILVQVVEELGAESFGKYANLEVVDIEKGRWFKIDEYDGYESIQYRDIDDEWILAD